MKRHIMLLSSATVLVLLGVIMNVAHATPTMVSGPSRQGGQGGWQYQAYFDQVEGRIFAEVAYPRETAAQVREYAGVQQQLAQQLIANGATSIKATIVFRHPLKQSAFERFVATNNLTDVAAYKLRFKANRGERITISGGPNATELVPQDLLSTAVNAVQEREAGALLGWVEVQATISSQSYDALLRDKSVYLVDVSEAVIGAAFADDEVARTASVDVIMDSSLYWTLEDRGLVSNTNE